ncbi:MAG: hypothetical protein ABGX47_12500 [Martelella sp.]|uniref:hypothetical protein n=1 Tax=Martelella sp. TaxID=1969699 RepID=UPI0032426CC1
MTSTGKDALWSFLFASEDCTLVNLKLMRGDSNDVSLSDLRDEVHSALLQARTGAEAVEDFPEESEPLSIDVRELATTI